MVDDFKRHMLGKYHGIVIVHRAEIVVIKV